MLNNKSEDVVYILILVVIIILVIAAIWALISLLMENKKEDNKAKERIRNENAFPAMEGAYNEDLEMTVCNNYGSAYNDMNESSSGFYSSVRHFTDTGRAHTQSRVNSMGGYNCGRNFVIIKSVIHTETREEIEQEM